MGILRLLLALAVVFAHAGPLFGVRALAMTGGQSVAIEIDAAAGGELLRKVS